MDSIISTIENAAPGTMSAARETAREMIAALDVATATALRTEAARRTRLATTAASDLADRATRERGLGPQVHAARSAADAWGAVVAMCGRRIASLEA